MRKIKSQGARAAQAMYRFAIRTICATNHRNGRSGIGSNSVLLVRTDGIGDFVLFSPALRHIKRLFKSYRISMIVNDATADLACTCPYIDELILCDMARYKWGFPYRYRTILKLQTGNFDMAIYPVCSQEPLAQELTYCSGATQTVVVDGDLNNITADLKKRNEKYFSRWLKVPSQILPELERNRLVVEMLAGERIESSSFLPELWLTESDRFSARQMLAAEDLKPKANLIVGLAVGAAWQGRQWPAERFVQIAKKILTTYPAKIIVVGSPKDASLALTICARVGPGSHVLAGKTTLRELAGVFELCDFVIANESGPLHIAAAMGTPTLALIGGGHFGRFYPYGDLNKHRMVFEKMDCYQCNWQCIYDTVRCVQEISCDDVWRETKRLVDEVILPAREFHLEESGRPVE